MADAKEHLDEWCARHAGFSWSSGPGVEVDRHGTTHTLNLREDIGQFSIGRPGWLKWRVRVYVPKELPADAARAIIARKAEELTLQAERDLANDHLGSPRMATHRPDLTTDQKATRRALLAGIREDPEDNDRRLIFSDFLEETGNDLWASLIRTQVALSAGRNAGTGGCRGKTAQLFPCDGPAWDRKNARRCGWCELLAEEARVKWHMEAGPDVRPDPIRPARQFFAWDRGFVGEIAHLSLESWYHLGPRLVAVHPIFQVRVEEEATLFATPDRRPLGVVATARHPVLTRMGLSEYPLAPSEARFTLGQLVSKLSNLLLDWAEGQAKRLEDD